MQRSRIFVSYRREDAQQAAGRLAADLRTYFDRDQVFEDIASIAPGSDFMEALHEGLASCCAVVVVIGPNWAALTDRHGKRRIDSPDDWVRQEVAYGLQQPGVRVFPVLVDDAHMPRVEELPEDLQPLTRRQATPVTVRHWAKDVGLLADHLKRIPGLDKASVMHAPPPSPKTPPTQEQPAAPQAIVQGKTRKPWYLNPIAIVIPALLVIVVLSRLFFAGDKSAPTPAAASAPEIPSSATAAPATTPFALGNKDCDVCPEMVVIPTGSFVMGSPANEQGRASDEGPQHKVTIPVSFVAGRFEVTFDEWDACVRERGCTHRPEDEGWGRGKRPVIHVSWNDAEQYVQWLSTKTRKTYRLLSSAEWEYVARAGTKTPFNTGANINPVQANYDTSKSLAGSLTAKAREQTVTVGSFQANAFGIYDVHGNVWEWTEDCWNANYAGATADSSAWTVGDCGQRVVRGGSWQDNPHAVRSAVRNRATLVNRDGNLGFRVARTL